MQQNSPNRKKKKERKNEGKRRESCTNAAERRRKKKMEISLAEHVLKRYAQGARTNACQSTIMLMPVAKRQTPGIHMENVIHRQNMDSSPGKCIANCTYLYIYISI